jgi:hypothetical protein
MAQTQTLITATDYNASQALIADVLGLGENGWGIPLIQSNPTDAGRRVYAGNWNGLLGDINLVNNHIYGQPSSISYVTSSTTITAQYSNDILSISDQLSSDLVRYTCDPVNFLYNTLTNTTTQYSDSVSLRTLPWGANGITSITHKMVISWANRLSARYYFNEGNYLIYKPYYSGTTGLNDLDTEWATFIDWVEPQPWIYGHEKFTEYRTTTTNWSSGTLEISLIARLSTDDKSIEVDVTYLNNASADLILSPTVGIYTIV